ncbi:MAG: diacylglycerol kinase family lipid kinase [Acidobacteriia bacterium]|nr:diacylglycerol kinase family lipid kinase [Terriglobia bacterium]
MPSPFQNALLIHNPNAGNGGARRKKQLEEAQRILAAGGIHAELAETRGPGDATTIARQACVEGRQLVIACGGDGTLNEVVNGLADPPSGRHVPLALFPAGTANVLAKELGIPWNIPRAAELLLRCEVREIALGLATPLAQPEKKRYFVSVAGAGPDGQIVHSVDPQMKARVGILAYWWQGIGEAFRYRFPRFRVTTPEKQMDVTLVIAGRTRHYGGPFRITTEASLLEDRFELCTLTTRSGLRYLSHLPALALEKIRGRSGIHFWKSDKILCEALGDDEVYAQVDGEALARLPVEFRIVPRALTLMLPAGWAPR